MDKIKNFVEKHPELSALSLLTLLCFLFLFWGLNFYNLVDVDETRYAIMSRDLANSNDWNVLLLNSIPFLEKPPLYFWLVAISIKMFGTFSPFVVRFPIAILSAFLVFFTYFFGRKILSRKFGLYSSIILLSSTFFLILSHVAILDMVLTVLITSSLYCAFMSFFTKDNLKKYCWWGFWTFAGLGFLAKGILAIAIPAVVMFLYCLITKTLKEMFKPVNFIFGFIIFLLIALPWHITMFKDYGMHFVQEYFIKHHFARLLTSQDLGRKHGFFYFVPIFIVAFLPWTFVFLGSIYEGFKKLLDKFKKVQGSFVQKLKTTLYANTAEEKLILFASIFFVIVFGVMSVSSTKLPTYILPALPAAALLTGYFWTTSNNEQEKTIKISTYILSGIFIMATIIAAFSFIFLPFSIIELINDFKYPVMIGCGLIGMLLVIELKAQKYLSVFASYVVTMLFILTVTVTNIFNVIYAGGENELVLFSNYASTTHTKLVTFDFAVKPSVKINHEEFVYFITDRDFDKLNNLTRNKVTPVYVIVKNKEVINGNYQKELNRNLYLLQQGRKYSLYINKNLTDKQKVTQIIK
ncbi:MAG: ArnT family glycosyltransferase [Candidatus Gastranaerophilaceae bacterium]